VELSPVSLSEVEKIRFNRLNIEFRPYINFCRLFLQASTMTLQGSEVEFFSFIIPMEALFERFVAKAVKQIVSERLKKWKVHVQRRYSYLITKPQEAFQLQPDIVIEDQNGRKTIIDTKYKLLEPEERKLGITQQDLYQIYTYSKELNAERCLLLYPETLNAKISKHLTLGKDKINLHIHTIPLHKIFDGKRLSNDITSTIEKAPTNQT